MTSEDTATPPSIWYGGSVATAVENANARGSLLLVCLVQVPIMVVPSLYLIRNGLLADFMNSAVDVDQMLERIRKAADGHFQIPPPPTSAAIPMSPIPSTQQASPSSSMASIISTEPSAVTSEAAGESSSQLASSTSNQGPTSTSPASELSRPVDQHTVSSVSSSASNTTPKADQAKALKELMNERKLKREKEEKEIAKQREKDRRSSSKALSDAQRELNEKQNKKMKDQIEKEKREEAEYKKKVKQALEEDKARRKAEKEKTQAAAAALKTKSTILEPEQVLTPSDIRAQNSGLSQARNDAAPALAFETSRLNIRLFDGSSIRNTFKATDTLEQVREWINENQEEGEKAYNIVQLIPPRTFTDESKMLRDLELCPSATLVLKKTAAASSAYGGSDEGAVPTLMSYGWSAFNFAGKLASSAYSTAAYYNPLTSLSAGSASGSEDARRAAEAGSSKKKDRETSYNG
ncbi:hypothetical protein BGX28_007331 [Mortierella sp. GBA30]|nr:hypothetical protein BGX28_007331 [Mortierella sp. GBA30]